VSRKLRIRPTGAAVVVGAMIGAAALAGCGAGQITQTSEQVAAVAGASGNAGPIAVRDAVIEFAEDAEGAAIYPVGGAAPLQMSIVNAGPQPDRLVSASSPAAASVRISGIAEIPPGQVVVVEGVPAAAPTPTTAPQATQTAGAAPAPTAGAAPTPTAAAPTPTPTAAAPAPTTARVPFEQGTQVVLTGLREEVNAGLTYPVVLSFERAGDVRMDVPVANSVEPREGEAGH
jgi:copper(I)-binding protein